MAEDVTIRVSARDEASGTLGRLQQRIKAMRMEERASGESALKSVMGRGMGGIADAALDMAGIGLPAFIFDQLGRGVESTVQKAIELKHQFEEGKATIGDMVEGLARGLPIIGGWIGASSNIAKEWAGINQLKRENDALASGGNAMMSQRIKASDEAALRMRPEGLERELFRRTLKEVSDVQASEEAAYQRGRGVSNRYGARDNIMEMSRKEQAAIMRIAEMDRQDMRDRAAKDEAVKEKSRQEMLSDIIAEGEQQRLENQGRTLEARLLQIQTAADREKKAYIEKYGEGNLDEFNYAQGRRVGALTDAARRDQRKSELSEEIRMAEEAMRKIETNNPRLRIHTAADTEASRYMTGLGAAAQERSFGRKLEENSNEQVKLAKQHIEVLKQMLATLNAGGSDTLLAIGGNN